MVLHQFRNPEPMVYTALGTFFAGLLAFVLVGDQVEATFDAGRLAFFGLGIGAVLATAICFTLKRIFFNTLSSGTKLAIIGLMWQGVVLVTCAFAFYSNYLIADKQVRLEQMPVLSKQDGKGATQHWYALSVKVAGNNERIYVCHDIWKNINTNQHIYSAPVWMGLWGFRFTSASNCN